MIVSLCWQCSLTTQSPNIVLLSTLPIYRSERPSTVARVVAAVASDNDVAATIALDRVFELAQDNEHLYR
jgi:hypothetical protein